MVDENDALLNQIHHLIKHGDIGSIRNLLDEGLNPNFANSFGWTLLILTAGEGNTALGELLISRGADVNLRPSHAPDPLTAAIMSGHIQFAKLLFDHGARPDPNLEGWLHMARLAPKQNEAILAMARAALVKRTP
jgi:uncharacterized protein